MGEPVTIIGSFFGEQRGDSYVVIAGAQPTGTAYMEWSENSIRLRLPEFGEAGLVFVNVGGRRSNGVLFANRSAIPVAVGNGRRGLAPSIDSVNPGEGAVGSLVSISGSGFGDSRGNGVVFFSVAGTEAETEVSQGDFGYEFWSDREIRVRVPDGSTPGSSNPGTLTVRTARGDSPPVSFTVSGGPGTKSFSQRRTYFINYSVDIRTEEAGTPNALHLWVPSPALSPAQRGAQMLFSSPEPFIPEFAGTGLYGLENLMPGDVSDINLSWALDVYGVRTSVRQEDIKTDTSSPIRTANIGGFPGLPQSEMGGISQLASTVAGRESNPYIKAGLIYWWMLENIEWEERSSGDTASVAETKKADSFLGALFYAAMLRSSGVPARPVAGVLVDDDKRTVNHYWDEFWIDGLGWIPVDPAMGAALADPAGLSTAAVPEGFVFRPPAGLYDADPAAFYFGNMDNRRIAFSRGFTEISGMDPRGRTVAHTRSFALQTLWEEATGGLRAYSSLWDIIITGMDVQ